MLKDLADNPAGVHGLAVRPDGKQAAAASAKTVTDLGPGRRDPRQGPRRPRR